MFFIFQSVRLLRKVNRNELNARVEPCGTCKWKIESGKLKVIFHEVFLFVLTPKARCFVFWVGFFYLCLKDGPSGTPVPTVILLTTGGYILWLRSSFLPVRYTRAQRRSRYMTPLHLSASLRESTLPAVWTASSRSFRLLLTARQR